MATTSSPNAGPFEQHKLAAHGGPGWVPRILPQDGPDPVWAECGVSSECGELQSVLMRRPGSEIENITDPASILWSAAVNPERAREEHDNLVEAYRSNGVTVHLVEDSSINKPNMYFTHDLFAMTPAGAILGRPASLARAGEERHIAGALIHLGIPILLSPYAGATFEGADVIIVNKDLVLIGEGIRTNRTGATQARRVFEDLGFPQVEVVQVPYGCGHLDGTISIVDRDVAVLFPTQVAYRVWEVLRAHGFRILDLPDPSEAHTGMAINTVALAPGRVLIPAGNPKTVDMLSKAHIECTEVAIPELQKGGGAIHCMTGVLKRNSLN